MAELFLARRSALRARQLQQLQELVGELIPANRFYTAKLRAAGHAGPFSSLEDLTQLPFTTKTELVIDQQSNPPFGSNLTYPLERYTRYHQTSGTTGVPLSWLDTPGSWNWMLERWLEIFSAAGVTAADRLLFAFSFGPFLGFWLAFEAGTRLGALCLPGGGLGTLGRVRLILEAGVSAVCCTPTYAVRLATTAREEKLEIPHGCIRALIVAGEPGGSIPATRARLESLWPGARIFDHHGMTETGPVTYECPLRPGFLHIMESAFLAEIVNPATGKPVEPGQPGELILTNFGRTGSPLLRYRTGDLVKQDRSTREAVCACGRVDLALEGGILGRVDDMLIVRGVNVYPTAVEDVLRKCGEVVEYQVQINRAGALTEMKVVIEPGTDCVDAQALVNQVAKQLQHAFALRIPVEAVPCGTLPRFEMKSKRWIVS